ncbi:MAG: 4-hydroxy-tetrahydrodipicolinate reductase [Eubacteriales bacterium]|nr:4-hydroxy-tetrahydrodipicolinate reductase [Eubacteriales bacterium]MDD4326978.1 4-hydroxy-tetrahydrodipicolinate reductase [Eubacteriales bacterium]MDD4717162.1 4-hydroxy-tetrahydrodipicolinate reductase [Eubacteriales bacterium]
MSVKILLHGCNGHMGRVISESVKDSTKCRVVCGIDIDTTGRYDYPVFSSSSEVNVDFDVIIDFSHLDAVSGILDFSAISCKPIVLATTGLTDDLKKKYVSISEKVPVFISANMSLGVNMLVDLARRAAAGLSETFDIEIIESHHRRKLDAPSGTAFMIADALNDACGGNMEYVYDRHSESRSRNNREIGICSIRGGTIPGEHTVVFAGNEEVIEITHRAQSRNIFARGALAAAMFIADQPAGIYSMDDLLSAGRSVSF